MPSEVWKPELVDCLPSRACGVLLLTKRDRKNAPPVISVECVKRSRPNKNAERLTPEQAVDVARLANLRMWEAFADVERIRDDSRRMLAATTAGASA
jgi:hypothetical protein